MARAPWWRRMSRRTRSPRSSSRWTGIPVDRMLEGEREKLLHMEERLAKRVVGQDEAVDAVVQRRAARRAGLQDPNRPIGSFIFLGPTGVGKTELSQGARGVPVRRRERHGAHRHERVHGEALRRPPDRRPARLRRLRRGRRSSPKPCAAGPTGGPVRRDREGPPRRVQRAAAGARRRPPDRRPGPHGQLQEHADHHDLQHRLGHSWPTRRKARTSRRCGPT